MTTLLLQTATELLFQTFVIFGLIMFWVVSRIATLHLLWQAKDRVFAVINALYEQFDRLIQSINRVADALTQEVEPPIAHTLRVFFPESLLTFEGANLSMNLKNVEQVGLTANFKNKFGGPAQIQQGSAVWTPESATGAFTVEVDPNNELRAILKGNPQSPGGPEDIGIVRVTVDGNAGEGVSELVAELAVNITPGDATIFDIQAGAVSEQELPIVQPSVGVGEAGETTGGTEGTGSGAVS